MCIEVYLLFNLAADLCLLWAASRVTGLYSVRRLALAGALCAAYAPLVASRPVPWATPPVQLALLALTSALLTGRVGLRRWTDTMLAILVAALIAGGTASLLLPGARGLAAPVGIGLGALLLRLLFCRRPPRQCDWQVRLCLRVGERTARFSALIDTGNRLREPLSGQPVLIAEAHLLKGLLPESGFRVLGFSAVGGDGRMACFRPSALWIESGRRRARAPDVWVAVAPGRLPGLCQALAPPEFAACVP